MADADGVRERVNKLLGEHEPDMAGCPRCRWGDAIVELVERERDAAVGPMRSAARFAFTDLLERVNVPWNDEADAPSEPPEHDCGYVFRPDTGSCAFHEEWFDAYSLAFDALPGGDR